MLVYRSVFPVPRHRCGQSWTPLPSSPFNMLFVRLTFHPFQRDQGPKVPGAAYRHMDVRDFCLKEGRGMAIHTFSRAGNWGMETTSRWGTFQDHGQDLPPPAWEATGTLQDLCRDNEQLQRFCEHPTCCLGDWSNQHSVSLRFVKNKGFTAFLTKSSVKTE